jgi:hypothetical protein
MGEATALIAVEKRARAEGKRLAKERATGTRTMGQLKRLLFDQLRHLSTQGFSAYPHDLNRLAAYGLARFARTPSKKPASTQPGTTT